MRTLHLLGIAALFGCSLGVSSAARAETVCGLVTTDQPELAPNYDELRKFTITARNGVTHTVVTEVDPDYLRAAPLRALREAKQERMEICVTGNRIAGAETKQLQVVTVDRGIPHPPESEAPIARAETFETTNE